MDYLKMFLNGSIIKKLILLSLFFSSTFLYSESFLYSTDSFGCLHHSKNYVYLSADAIYPTNLVYSPRDAYTFCNFNMYTSRYEYHNTRRNKLSGDYFYKGVLEKDGELVNTLFYPQLTNDNTAPTFGAETFSPTSQKINNGYTHNLWISESSLSITIPSLSDGTGSDISDYYWKKGNTKQLSKDPTITLTEGVHSLFFYVKDNLGNNDSFSKTVSLDNTAPSTVTPIFHSFYEEQGALKAKFSWPHANDDVNNLGSTQVSGILNYRLNGQTITPSTGDINYGEFEVTKGDSVTVTLISVDKAGNERTTYSEKLYVPQDLVIESNTSSYSRYNVEKPYKVKLEFNFNQDQYIRNRFANASYILYRGNVQKSTLGTASFENGQLIFIDELEDSYVHGNPKYKVSTVYPGGLYTHPTLEPYEVAIPNIPSSTNTELVLSNGTLYIDNWTNEVPKIQLSEEYSDIGTDAEGDDVKYQLIYDSHPNTSTNKIVELVNTHSNPQTIEKNTSVVFKIDTSGVYEFYVKRIETIHGGNGVPINTIPGDGEDLTDHLITINYDNIEPTILGFNIKGKSRGDEVGVTSINTITTTNNNVVSLEISISDIGGSGLNKIEVYDKNEDNIESNLSLKATYYFKTITESVNDEIQESINVYDNSEFSGNPIQSSITKNSSTGSYVVTIQDWELYSEADNDIETLVRLKLYDNAGNDDSITNDETSTYYQKSVIVDQTNPLLEGLSSSPIPVDINEDDDGEDKFIKFEWSSEYGSETYVSYTDNTNVSHVVGPLTSSSITLATVGYNQAKPISLKTYDAAGNFTEEVYEGYSKASFGTIDLNSIEQGVTITGDDINNDSINRWIKFKYINSVASSRKLQQVDDQGANRNNAITPDSEGYFLISGLGRRASVNYKLLALNGSNNETVSEIKTISLDNILPSFDTSQTTYPNDFGYITNGKSIRWPSAVDTDLDTLTYRLKIYELDGTLLEDKCKSGSTSFAFSDLGLTDNTTYKWNVSVNDGIDDDNDGVVDEDDVLFSTPRSFSVDVTEPTISHTNIPEAGFFTNINNLIFNVSDIEISGTKNSGVANVKTTITIANIPTIYESTTDSAFLPFSNSSTSEIEWAVPEGEVLVDIKVTDNVGLGGVLIDKTFYVDRQQPTLSTFKLVQHSDYNYFYTTNDLVSILFDIEDDYSGVSHLLYAFTSSNSGDVEKWYRKDINALIPGIGDSSSYSVEKELDYVDDTGEYVTNGTAKYLRLKIYDHAGNVITRNSTKPILKDKTKPLISSPQMSFFFEYGSQKYLSSMTGLNALNVSTNVKDDESGLKTLSKTIIEGSSEVETLEGATIVTTLEDGGEYSLIYYGQNNALLEEFDNIVSFVNDSSDPVDLTITPNKPTGRNYFVKGEGLSFEISVSEPHSPIVYSELTITNSDGIDITNSITGNINSKLFPNNSWVRSNSENLSMQTNSYSFSLPDNIVNDTYNVSVICKNGSDLEISNSTYSFDVANTSDTVTIEVPTYTTSHDNVSFEWNYIPSEDSILAGIEVTNISVKYKDENDNSWTDSIIDGSYITIGEDSTFIENEKYVFLIEATFSNGDTILGESNSTTIDTTDPDISNETELVLWPELSQSTSLYANWNVEDTGSGIGFINFKVEKYVDKVLTKVHKKEWIEVKGFKNIDSYFFGDLGLVSGDKVVITRQVIDKAGIFIPNYSAIIIIDDTPPAVPVVNNNTPYLNPDYARVDQTQRPTADWRNSEGDPDTGVTYFWAFVQSKENIEDDNIVWNTGTEDKDAIMDQGSFFTSDLHQETWYFAVKAENALGLVSYGFCDGVTFDNTAPYVSNVRVLEITESESAADNLDEPKYYINNMDNLHLYIQANDAESNIDSYEGEYGTLVENIFSASSAPSDFIETNTASIFKIFNISNELDTITFRGAAENGAGISEIGYSSTIIVDLVNPKVTNLIAINNNGVFSYSWNGVVGNSSIVDYEYRIEKDNNEFLDWTPLGSTIPRLVIDTHLDESYEDGIYVVKVKAVSDSGLKGDKLEEFGVSSELILDATDPVIIKPVTPDYASNTIELSLSATDYNGSGLNEYQYRIGTFTNPNLISSGWKTINSSDGIVNLTIDFDDFDTSYSGISDGEELYIRAMAKDNAGNWSFEQMSDVIIIDKTAAVVESLSIPRYSRFPSKIENITYRVVDSQSGIKLITYKLFELEGTNEILIFSYSESVNGDIIEETGDPLDLGADSLFNEKDYILKISAINGAGDECEFEVSSDKVTIDTVKPILTFTHYENEVVVNKSTEDNMFSVPYILSEIGDVEFTLIKPNSETEKLTLSNQNSGSANYGFHHWYSNDSLAYGEYDLIAVVYDRAGNDNYITLDPNNMPEQDPNSVYKQDVRFNRPPIVTISQTYTNPGRPIALSVNEQGLGTDDLYLATVIDLDGDYSTDDPFEYEWTFILGNSPENSSEIKKYGKNEEIAFYHSSNSVRRTAYPFELKVTDNKGQVTIMSLSGTSTNITDTSELLLFVVKNTWKGDFFVDEYWSSTADDYHKVFGDINVGFNDSGDRLKLTLEEDTVVEIFSNTESGVITYNHGLNISGDLRTKNNSLFRIENSTNSNWKGITFTDTGFGLLKGTTIKNAKRAITSLNSSNVTLDNCILENNIIGLHAFNSNPVLKNMTIIRNNIAYGIKEDGISNPNIAEDTVFTDNTINYYDSVNTISEVPGENK